MYLSLGVEELAYKDLAKVNYLEPVGERVLGECLYNKKLNYNKEELDSCYGRAVSAFERNMVTPEDDINYVFAKILLDNDDRSAIKQLLRLINETDAPSTAELYKFTAEELLGDELYRKLFPAN